MRINTNVSSLITRNYLNSANNSLDNTMERLSSGKRINGAADDAAGLAIATRMTTQIRGKDVAIRNAQDGLSMIQTAESALGSVTNILQRARELAVQADNGTLGTEDKNALKSEMDELVKEVNNIANNTTFNGNNLLDTAANTVSLHVGDGATDTMNITFGDANTDALGEAGVKLNAMDITAVASTLNGTTSYDGVTTLSSANGAQDAILTIDAALDQVSKQRAGLGASMNRLEFTVDNLSSSKINLSEARSRVEDADMAAEMSNLTKSKILSQSSISMLAQANSQPQSVLQLLG